MFEELGLEIKRLRDVDLDSLDRDVLRERAVALARCRAQLDAVEAETLAAYDRRGVWRASGAKAASADLAHRTRMSKVECKSRLATARALAKLPVAAEAFVAGEITADHVKLLARARNPRTAEAMARGEAVLVAQAKELRFDRWAKVVAYWSMRADPDGASEKELERRDGRHLSIVQTSGGWALTGFHDPAAGESVAEELRRLEQQLFDTDWAEAKERLGRAPLAGELQRTRAQRMADAHEEMAIRSAGSKKRAKPSFSVVMGAGAFAMLCELEASGTPITPSALVRWASEATVEAVLFGAGERDIKISHKRRFTGACRRVIELRGDRECFHPTCDETAPHCQADHFEPHSQGGITAPWNGRMACDTHNRGRHRRGPPETG